MQKKQQKMYLMSIQVKLVCNRKPAASHQQTGNVHNK